MDYSDFVSGIRFTLLPPERYPPPDELARLGDLSRARGVPFDLLNTQLPENDVALKRAFTWLCWVPRMSTFAIGAMIQRAVAEMPDGHVFLNIGVWNGFTLLSGMLGNPDKVCIGVDNFSDFGGPREAFRARFERWRTPRHRFHEMDYHDYFRSQHREPIGVYFYDGDHSYEHQLAGLRLAEPFLAPNCIIFVDDTNTPPPRDATRDFLAQRRGDYRVLLDAWTSANGHPTWWNGLMVLQRCDGGNDSP
jgi:hypothetical protein